MSSVLAASNSDIYLNGTMSFYNNKASHGAAIDFIHYHMSSFMNLLMLSFINKSATFYSGGIYSDMNRNLPNRNPLCTIQVVSKSTSEVILAGNSIYISPLYECQQLYLKGVNSIHLYNKLLNFKVEDINDNGEISSVAVRTHHCGIGHLSNNTQIEVYPGKSITIGLKVFDLNGNPSCAKFFPDQPKLESGGTKIIIIHDI